MPTLSLPPGAALLLASLLVGDGILALPDRLILLQIRLPRTLLAALVGGGLGLSGAVLQGALRNPLADPGLLGITGTAGLGAALVFYWGLAAHFAPALPLGGLAGAAVGAGCLLAFAGRAPSGPSLILAGVAVSALSASLLALALSLAPNPFALAEITFWLLGGLTDRSLLHVALAAPPILLGAAILLRLGPGLDALSLGEETAASLGVPVGRTLRLAAAGTALAAGAGAAVAGGIGFVGLVVPHLLRPLLGERPGRAAARIIARRRGAAAGGGSAGAAGAAGAAAVAAAAAGCADRPARRPVRRGDRPPGHLSRETGESLPRT